MTPRASKFTCKTRTEVLRFGLSASRVSDHVWGVEELVEMLNPKPVLDGLAVVA